MIKEIWCMPHSHLDIGYTHPQPLLLELQVDYINQAMKLIEGTKEYPEESQFRWTVEANYVLEKWLKTADTKQIEKLKAFIKSGHICVTALPMHTTPGCDAREMVMMLSNVTKLEKKLDTKINVAINHDVNGQPWTIGQMLLDSGIDFYLTGINIHFGGIPMPRPAAFDWQMSDGRKLRSFVGEHYSLFSQFLFTEEHNTSRMHEGVLEYTSRLEKNGYQRDFAFLTATNPPLYDNNCPDLQLAELVKKYNEEDHGYKIRIVTAQMLRDRILAEDKASVWTLSGDWTDYWNFGSGSTARETRVSRLAKNTLAKAEALECFQGESSGQYQSAKAECQENILLFDEHTWGASQSVTQPDHPETYAQLIHKKEMAYQAADLSGYLLSHQVEQLCQNPHQSNGLQGISLINTSGVKQTIEVKYPKYFRESYRQLSALRSKSYLPYMPLDEEMESAGIYTLEPFSYLEQSFAELDQNRQKTDSMHANMQVENQMIETPFYLITLDKRGGITKLFGKKLGREILDNTKGFDLFAPVHEGIDEDFNEAKRATLFPRNVDLGNRSISQWNHEWKAKRTTSTDITEIKILEDTHSIIISRKLCLEGIENCEQKIIFYDYQPQIRMEVSFDKKKVYQPESIYFAIPLKMQKDWKCTYDTAGEQVLLDEEQLGTVCRDWVTVDTAVAVCDPEFSVTLACPDAPLIQVGDFNFGKESKSIPRDENPLLLAWALNNYWDTNFCADQAGRMSFAYELNVHETMEAKTLWQEGLHAKQPVLAGALVDCKESNRQLFTVESNSIGILNSYPSEDSTGINLLVKNMGNEEDTITISSSYYHIREAYTVTPQENKINNLVVAFGVLSVNVPARAFCILKLVKEN